MVLAHDSIREPAHPLGVLAHPSGRTYGIRLATVADAPVVRRMLNEAYKELADMGLNYTASYQDETTTAEAIANARTLIVHDGDSQIGTIRLEARNEITGRNSIYIGRFGISTALKRNGIGGLLLNFVEEMAKKEGFDSAQLDTAKPASHLVKFYVSRGYQIIGETHFEGKSYDSWIFEKPL